MKIMGMSESAIWFSWLLTYTIMFSIISLLLSVILKSAVFPKTNFGYVFGFFLLYGLAIFGFCYMISSFFSNPKVASVVAAVIFLGIYFPYIAVSSFNVQKSTKTAASLSLNIALSLGLVVMTEFEGAEVGVNSNNVGTDVNNFNYSLATGMFILDFFIYNIIGIYALRVVPSEWGTNLPFYYPFTYSFWFPSSISHSSARLLVSSKSDEIHNNNIEPVSSAVASNLAVKLMNLNKSFQNSNGSDPTIAVNNLTLDMYSGQILALLGHNGAGKTTVINMLTGNLLTLTFIIFVCITLNHKFILLCVLSYVQACFQ